MNVYEGIPYQASGMGKRKLVDESHLLMMQVALRSGQAVPHHEANSNVHLLVLEGEIMITLNGRDSRIHRGDLQDVAKGTPMSIRNDSAADATFLVMKTPRPEETIA